MRGSAACAAPPRDDGAPRVVLATDLDGTFVGGSPRQRAQLYDWLLRHRDEVMLVFVSGRGQAHMRDLARSIGLTPDYMIGDVGTTVESGQGGHAPALAAVTRWLDSRWPAQAPARIDEVMRRHPGLPEQEGVSGRRKSYFLGSDALAAEDAAAELRALGFDVLVSDDRYFDVLPRGVQKGPTLLRTLRALRLPLRRTLVAGDTLNDLSMFRSGFSGVAVANREPRLEQALRGRQRVHLSAHPGAAGVLEALQRFHATGGGRTWLHNW